MVRIWRKSQFHDSLAHTSCSFDQLEENWATPQDKYASAWSKIHTLKIFEIEILFYKSSMLNLNLKKLGQYFSA